MEVRRLPEWVKTPYDLELYHSGVKNMKWGNRRYQNKDGSLTPLGRVHYGVGQARNAAGVVKTDIQSRMSNNEYGSARAANLGEVGTGVTSRSRLGDRSSISVSDDLSSITPKIKMKGKDYVDGNSLNDSSIDSLREHEVTQIGRFYCENSIYRGVGGFGVADRNFSDRRVLVNYYAKRGESQTGAISPYRQHKSSMESDINRSNQNWEYERRTTRRKLKSDDSISGEEYTRRMKEIDDKYDKEYRDIRRKYRSK